MLLLPIVPGGVLTTGGLHSSREGQRADHRAERHMNLLQRMLYAGFLKAEPSVSARRKQGSTPVLSIDVTEQRSIRAPYPSPKHVSVNKSLSIQAKNESQTDLLEHFITHKARRLVCQHTGL